MEKYTIFLSYPLSEPDRYKLNIFDGFADMGHVVINGLVRNFSFSGDNKLYLETESGDLICFQNIAARKTDIIISSDVLHSPALLRSLAEEFNIDINVVASLSAAIPINGGTTALQLGSTTSGLSIGIVAVISDWSDSLMSDLENKTLEELIYMEG